MDAFAFEKLSVAELSHFLTEKGIPATFCKAFEGIAKEICICTYLCCISSENLVNGRAFLKLSQIDVKKMVPPTGLAKKICALIVNSIIFSSLKGSTSYSRQTRNSHDYCLMNSWYNQQI